MAEYMTPGVYIEEMDGFPNSVVQVETSLPAFIGYTEKAEYKGEQLAGSAVRVTSLKDFETFFGGSSAVKFLLMEDKGATPSRTSVQLSTGKYVVSAKPGTLFYLYDSMRLFFANGGRSCYIVSVGDYSKPPQLGALEAGINALVKVQEPTMLCIPDGLLLHEDEYYLLAKSMLAHCSDMQNRIALLDVYDGATTDVKDLHAPDNVIDRFRSGIGDSGLSYGAAYYPWLRTTIVQNGEVNFTNFYDLSAYFEAAIVDKVDAILARYKDADEVSKDAVEKQAHNALLMISKNYTTLMNAATAALNILPPGPAMAGVYAVVDMNRGVWKAPANVGLNAVVSPTVNLRNADQDTLNVDATGGKSINTIRSFPGEGVLVWGARTLDGNSPEWRYINVRRTLIMIEQSAKLAARAYVFEPNDANSWVMVKAMIENFLNSLWRQGGLAGSTPGDAYSVQVGLGQTMTADDILNGIMNITVLVAVMRPAEFIVITFQQQMQKS
jgi:hypothetical protein